MSCEVKEERLKKKEEKSPTFLFSLFSKRSVSQVIQPLRVIRLSFLSPKELP